MKVHRIQKKIGETPLEALEKFRKKAKISPAAKLTYAGRLDPMASGVLLILEGATQAQREKYMGLNKEYEVKVLFGFETDSYDLLGLPRSVKLKEKSAKIREGDLLGAFREGHLLLPVPPYSSVPYKGKPLFEWARAGKKVKLPLREMNVKKIKLKGIKWVKGEKIWEYIERNLNKVKGDFRQEKILKAWEEILKNPSARVIPESRRLRAISGIQPSLSNLDSGSRMHSAGMTQPQYLISNILISVSSGTYIRSIAHDLGKKLGTGGVVFSLQRTKVGKYKKSL